MPDHTTGTRLDQKLDQLLAYGESPSSDGFVLDVMQQVRRQQQIRRLILFVFGLLGAAFGVLGAVLLSGSISHFFTTLPVMGTMQGVLAVAATVAFYAWLMNEDIALSI